MTREPALFPSERELARLVLGPDRAKDWPAKAAALEREGLPPINELMGGRYWPDVEEFFRLKFGPQRSSVLPFAPDGEETPHVEKEAAARRGRTDRRNRGARPQDSTARGTG